MYPSPANPLFGPGRTDDIGSRHERSSRPAERSGRPPEFVESSGFRAPDMSGRRNEPQVPLSSIVKGFNVPSLDPGGDPLQFAGLVERAIRLLPEDLTIVFFHARVGTVEDLRAYHEMLVATERAVRGVGGRQGCRETEERNAPRSGTVRVP